MARLFRRASERPDAPRCLSKHGTAVHKDAYCAPASVQGGCSNQRVRMAGSSLPHSRSKAG